MSQHAARHAKGLGDDGERLPDEKDDGKIRFVAGGLDGAFGGPAGNAGEKVTRVRQAIVAVLEEASDARLRRLYDELLDGNAIDYVDPLLEDLAGEQRLDHLRLGQLAAWLAKGAPDREPVKVAVALTGLRADESHRELLLTLGRHEEFTLYAAVALMNLGDAERNLFELAQHVDGWGRIQIVDRLADTRDPTIKAWMLREGYKNSIMYEYLAYTCATAGDLRGELAKGSIDSELLVGAGELIQALINGGPAADIDDYADGAEVVESYLRHLGTEPRRLDQLVVVDRILGFLDEKQHWSDREKRGWSPERRAKLRAHGMAVRGQAYWPGLIREGLDSNDDATFATADQAARVLGIDTWDWHFARLQQGNDIGWYFVMQTDDPARIDRVLALGEERIPLEQVASGPGNEVGLGEGWAHHSHLDFIMQDLRRFPGKGWVFLRAGIRSPVMRNRHGALRAFSRWGKRRWPAGAQELLELALKEEPEDTVRSELEAVLAGRVIEDPRLQVPPKEPEGE